MMEPRRPASKSSAAAETEITTGSPSTVSTTESQLIELLSESRREADSLRRELAAVQKKADADHRRLQSLLLESSSNKSADIQVREFKERITHAEAALYEAEKRSRIVESNWLEVDRYLGAVQEHAFTTRKAFSSLLEGNDRHFGLPVSSPPVLRHERLPRERILTPATRSPPSSRSRHRRHDSSPPHTSPRDQDYIRPLPLLAPRRVPSSRRRSPSDDGWDGYEEGHDGAPPYKRHRAEILYRPHVRCYLSFPSTSQIDPAAHPQSPRARSPPHHRRSSTAATSPTAITVKYESDRSRHPSREYMPPPPLLPHPHPHARHDDDPRAPYQHPRHPPDAALTYDYDRDPRHPPLQIIQHPHPPFPPQLSPPPRDSDAPPPRDGPHQFQHQHRFHLGTGGGTRRLVRPGAYETVVFALDEEAGWDVPDGRGG
ncbi:hypothetical protein DFH07DRAFT_1065583 [Mycena maculata]|uniref:Uncharacterized protein n=1 Tax=Mycena maculata TaxID=230809 RepID=A0AAD7I231_9AGAR|nr:hypothetical protein DFH07DRAFT_1065583 [Mycena maculata]